MRDEYQKIRIEPNTNNFFHARKVRFHDACDISLIRDISFNIYFNKKIYFLESFMILYVIMLFVRSFKNKNCLYLINFMYVVLIIKDLFKKVLKMKIIFI